MNRKGAKDAKRDFLLVCYDPGRGTKDQNTPSPAGGKSMQRGTERCSNLTRHNVGSFVGLREGFRNGDAEPCCYDAFLFNLLHCFLL